MGKKWSEERKRAFSENQKKKKEAERIALFGSKLRKAGAEHFSALPARTVRRIVADHNSRRASFHVTHVGGILTIQVDNVSKEEAQGIVFGVFLSLPG